MALNEYYGLKNVNTDEIIECGWTEIPILNLYSRNINDGQWYHCYANSTAGIRQAYTKYSSPLGGPSYFHIPHSSTDKISFAISSGTTTYSRVTATVTGYRVSLTQTIGLGSTVYQFDSTTEYTVCKYYEFTVSASTNSVGGTQVGNIALYNGSTLVAGSESKSSESSASFNWSITTESSSLSLKFVATALTSNISQWHNKYFYNGITRDSYPLSDGEIAFSSDTATFSFTLANASTTFNVDYGAKYGLTINALPSGVQSTKVSYTRTHSTGNYVTTTTSPIELSGAGTLYVESGRAVKFEATAKSGNVFSTSNGFISQTSGVDSIYGNNSNSITANPGIPTMLKACSFSLTTSTYTISVSIPDNTQKGWGSVYIDQSGTTSKTLVLNQSYGIHFVSSKDNQEAPTVAGWYVNGVLKSTAASYTYTASSLSGNVSVTCVLSQNAWPVTVRAQSNGAASVAGRYMKSTGATLTPGYLFADGRDYMKVNVTPNDHYDENANSRVVSNLSAYSAGGAYAYSLASATSGALTFYFVLAECVIKTQIGNSGLPVADANICTTSPESDTRRFDAGSSAFLNVYCNIKNQYIGIYRCDYWLIGSVQREAEAGGTGQYYLTLSPSDWQNRSELVCIPHLVSTSNQLTVTKSGDQAFATVYVKPSETEPEESISGSTYTKSVKEGKLVIARIVAKFGGQIGNITYTGIENPSVTESQITFQMPSNNCSVNFAISEKDKVTLALCVANTTNPVFAVGKITLTAPGSSDVHEEVNTLQPQSRNIYKNTTYTLTATDDDLTYMFSGWYKNDSEYVSSSLSINISCSSSEKYTAVYVMRQSGTITVNYGIKSGDDVTPTDLPEESSPFGLVIDTPPDQTNPNKWVIGNSRYIDFHVLDNGIEVDDGVTYVWTPVRVEVKANVQSESYSTVWTYDELNPESRSGRFIMRDNMLVRLVFTRVEVEGYSRVRALFMGGMNAEMGELSIFSTKMESYYSLGGEAEAVCLVGKKVVLAAAPRPGWSFGGWYKMDIAHSLDVSQWMSNSASMGAYDIKNGSISVNAELGEIAITPNGGPYSSVNCLRTTVGGVVDRHYSIDVVAGWYGVEFKCSGLSSGSSGVGFTGTYLNDAGTGPGSLAFNLSATGNGTFRGVYNLQLSRRLFLGAGIINLSLFSGTGTITLRGFKVYPLSYVPVESNGAVLTVDSAPSAGCTYFADFAQSSSGVKAWNDDENPKVFEWRSKVYVGAQFFALRNLRIYSDVYPVTITLMTATSPNGCFTPFARTLTMQITSQSPRLIPVMRLEKYFAFKVNGTGRINHIAIASGMEAMK